MYKLLIIIVVGKLRFTDKVIPASFITVQYSLLKEERTIESGSIVLPIQRSYNRFDLSIHRLSENI